MHSMAFLRLSLKRHFYPPCKRCNPHPSYSHHPAKLKRYFDNLTFKLTTKRYRGKACNSM